MTIKNYISEQEPDFNMRFNYFFTAPEKCYGIELRHTTLNVSN